ncbi:IS5 family transposase, partial [Roseomonas mucosa]
QHAICRAARLAARLGGMPLLILIRRLGLRAALPAPPWLLPDPLLSETVARLLRTLPLTRENLRSLMAVARTADGRRRIPRSVRLSWP